MKTLKYVIMVNRAKMPGFVDYLSTTGYLLLIADVYAAYALVKTARGAPMSKEMGYVPFFLGVASLGLSLFMDVAWPLPGPYNFVFGDPFTAFSVLLLSAGAELIFAGNLKNIEGLAIPVGLIAILYGLVIAMDSLDPVFVWGMFVLEGIAGIGTGIAVNSKSKALLWIAILLLALASLLLAVVCVQTSFEHVGEFAKYFPRRRPEIRVNICFFPQIVA